MGEGIAGAPGTRLPAKAGQRLHGDLLSLLLRLLQSKGQARVIRLPYPVGYSGHLLPVGAIHWPGSSLPKLTQLQSSLGPNFGPANHSPSLGPNSRSATRCLRCPPMAKLGEGSRGAAVSPACVAGHGRSWSTVSVSSQPSPAATGPSSFLLPEPVSPPDPPPPTYTFFSFVVE